MLSATDIAKWNIYLVSIFQVESQCVWFVVGATAIVAM